MKIKPLLEKLSNNWPAKAVCIVIACLFYIFNRYASLEQKSLPVTLKVVQNGEMVCTTHIPSSVSVTIRTSNEKITQVTANGITATLDLSYFTQEGNFDVPVSVDFPSSVIELDPMQITVYPEKVKVRLERNILKTVKIIPQITGQLQYGYTVTSLGADPGYVSIYGPRSIIESITSISTIGIPVDDRESTFSQKVELVNLNRLIEFKDANTTQVTVNMDYVSGLKTYSGLPVVIKNIAAGLETNSKFTGNITIKGPQLYLDDFVPNPDTLSVNLGSVTEAGEYDLPVEVLIPTEFLLDKISVETVHVIVKERPPAIVVDETQMPDPAAESGKGEDGQ